MNKKTEFVKAEKLLRQLLIGDFYYNLEVGDQWTLRFSKVFLVAQNIIAPEESSLNELLRTAVPPVLDGIDAEYVAKGIVALRNIRQKVKDVVLAPDASLHLMFEHGRSLVATTNVEIVDWQWVVNISGHGPYNDVLIACFWQGEVVFGDSLPLESY